MQYSKKRVRALKITIIGFNVLLFLIIASILIWFGKIRFEWSDQLILKYKYEKNKSKFKKILVLGDSQLEKWPIKHCLYKDIERFCKTYDIGYVNAAHHGFGPIEYKDRLAYIGPDYKPSLIILFYYVGNDLTDVMLRSDEVPKKPTYDVVFIEGKSDSLIEGKSDSQKLDKRTITSFDWDDDKYQAIDPTIIDLAKKRAINPHILEMSVWHPDYLVDNNTVASTQSRGGWYNVLEIFEEILVLCDQVNSAICIVAIPSTVQVDSSHFDFYRKAAFNVPGELTSSRKAQDLLYDFSSASSIKYLDLLPYFKAYSNTASLYFENDDHLSEEGHQLAFNLLREEILECFLDTCGNYRKSARAHNYYKDYFTWAVNWQVEQIKKDPIWFNEIRKKAETRLISVDSMLFLDARYVLEN